ncbi:lipoamide acyltransferase component of branched-chain alpha-keto acid dehydrogenase complex [Acidimicrobiaceae bacterium]|nr:lipoamide acyltransferase component of branched-chain alpha-keto acid dehydrogenase complex [Acidimicrobiaceae bacterium]
MIMSQAVSAHAFSVVEVDYANVDATRSEVKDQWKQSEGFTLTYLPFIARAIVDALAEYPNLNASIEADKLVVHNYVDLGIAVDLEFQVCSYQLCAVPMTSAFARSLAKYQILQLVPAPES